MNNLITSLLFAVILVNIAALNQCTTSKQTPQQTNDCFHAGYVHIDSLNALRALNEAKTDGLVLNHKRELDEIEDYYLSKLDSVSKYSLHTYVLKVTKPFEGEHEYDIHIPDSLKVGMEGPYSPVRNTYRIRLYKKSLKLPWD